MDQPAHDGGAALSQASLTGHLISSFQLVPTLDFLMSKGATFEVSGTTAKICKCCGATGAKMKCALCLTVYYCSPECQTKGWKEGGENRHKIQCAALTEMRASYMEKAMKEIEEKIALFGRRQ